MTAAPAKRPKLVLTDEQAAEIPALVEAGTTYRAMCIQMFGERTSAGADVCQRVAIAHFGSIEAVEKIRKAARAAKPKADPKATPPAETVVVEKKTRGPRKIEDVSEIEAALAPAAEVTPDPKPAPRKRAAKAKTAA